MRDKTLQIRADDDFLAKVEYLRHINGFRSVAETVRKIVENVNACKTVCEKYHVPCIDTYTELGFNPYSYKAYFNVKGVDGATASDGTHPKQAGRQLRADRIVGQMEALY